MNRAAALYAIAWIAVPAVFAASVCLAYSWSLARGKLPFTGEFGSIWWIWFIAALLIGVACVAKARPGSWAEPVLWPALYFVVMAAVLLLPVAGEQGAIKWGLGFVVALHIGAAAVVKARPESWIGPVLWPTLYIVVMAAVLLGVGLAVACYHGDCF
jgi:hypothetical protein